MSNNIHVLAEKGMYEDACRLIDKSPDIVAISEASCLSGIVSYYQLARLEEAKKLCESYFYLVSDNQVTTVFTGPFSEARRSLQVTNL